MSNLGRVLTIRVKITDPEKANWIWDAHTGPSQHGVQVEAISNGDATIVVPKRFYIQEEGETFEEAIAAHCDSNGFESASEAAREAPKNVDFGSNWNVIDQTGKVYFSGTAPERE